MRFLVYLAIMSTALFAQQGDPSRQIVSFGFSNSTMKPSEYQMQLSNDCDMNYTGKGGEESEELVEQGSDDDEKATTPNAFAPPPTKEEQAERVKRFDISRETCAQVFSLAKQARYFDGDFEFRKHKVAYTGDRVLGYFSPGVSHKTAFTWSADPSIQQLSAIFEGIAATVEAGPKLEREYRFEPLGLNQQLGDLVTRAQKGYLREIRLIEPVLTRIANDPKVMNIARQRASQLLQLANSPQSSK
jgi:hypothetical protein